MSAVRSPLASALVIAVVVASFLVFCSAAGAAPGTGPVSEPGLASEPSVDPGDADALSHGSRPAPASVRSNGTAPQRSTARTIRATDRLRALAEDQSAAAATDVELEQTLALTPERPGSYDARNEYVLPDGLASLEVDVPPEATVVEAPGFDAIGDGSWTWDGTTDDPSIRLRVSANRTTDRDDPIAGPGDYLFVDVGEWAIVQRPGVGHSWSWRGDGQVGFERRMEAEAGVAGDVIAYLGAYETHRLSASGQQFTLVEPAAASLAESPDAILEELAYGSDALRIGDRDDEVLAIAAPTTGVQWGVRGLQTGSSDLWVRDLEPLDDPHNVWLHEYVHSRQDWTSAPSAQWLTEATATYYGALLTLERGGIDYDQFARRLERGESTAYTDVRLSQPPSWTAYPEYHLGSLTVGTVDRRIRLATGGEQSLQNVLRAFNEQSGAIDAATARAAVAGSGGDDVADLFQRLAETGDRPATWSRAEHETAFGTVPSRIGYRLPEGETSLRVSGQYRDRALGSDRILVPGEQLAASVTVENAGETSGDFEATLRLADDQLDVRRGRLSPGASTTVTLEGTVSAMGHATLRVGDAKIPVTVREPATASVTAIEAQRDDVAAREPVAVDVTLRNDASWPAVRELVLVAGGRELDSSTVRLDAGETRTLTRSVRLSSGGTTRISARGADVRSQPIAVASGWRSTGTVVGVALVALVLAVVTVQYRGRR